MCMCICMYVFACVFAYMLEVYQVNLQVRALNNELGFRASTDEGTSVFFLIEVCESTA